MTCILTNWETALGLYSVLIHLELADWSFENMNPAMTPCVMLVYQILMYRHRKQIKKIQQTSSFNWIVAMVICFIIFPMC